MKKYSWDTLGVPKKQFLKIILCMKLTIFLMVAFCLQLAANVHSQSITMQMQNTSLKKIFLEIEKKSIYSVIFNDDAIPKEKVFSVNASNEDLRVVLDNLLSSTSLTYKIQNTLLVITSKSAMQARPITGKVTDSKNQALIGVSVSIKGTSKGAATDENGNYRISVDDENSILVFSYLGFKTIEKSVGSSSVINVTMIEDNEALNEVVVIGYGGVRKSDLTGSVVSLKSKELTAYPAAGVQQALQGRAAGVQGRPRRQPGSHCTGRRWLVAHRAVSDAARAPLCDRRWCHQYASAAAAFHCAQSAWPAGPTHVSPPHGHFSRRFYAAGGWVCGRSAINLFRSFPRHPAY